MNILLPLHYKGYLNKISKAMQTTAIRTVAYLLPKNEVNLLTLLISKGYIPYTNLRKNFGFTLISPEILTLSPRKYSRLLSLKNFFISK